MNNHGKCNSKDIEDDDLDLNDLLIYIDKHGTISNEKKKKVFNPDLISIGNKQIIIKRSLFKHDQLLKEKLLKLPREGIDDVLRMILETIFVRYLSERIYIELYDWEIILINDDQ